MKLFKKFVAAGLLVLFVFSNINAEVPNLMNYQGFLTDSVGDTVPDGNYSVTFRIYDDSIVGISLWEEGRLITVQGGLFSVLLGSITPIPDSVFDEPNRWLGIQIGLDSEITPRARFVTAPFSFLSRRSDVSTLSDSAGFANLAAHSDEATLSDTSKIAIVAFDSDSLGGLPASSYLTTSPAGFRYFGTDSLLPIEVSGNTNYVLASSFHVPAGTIDEFVLVNTRIECQLLVVSSEFWVDIRIVESDTTSIDEILVASGGPGGTSVKLRTFSYATYYSPSQSEKENGFDILVYMKPSSFSMILIRFDILGK